MYTTSFKQSRRADVWITDFQTVAREHNVYYVFLMLGCRSLCRSTYTTADQIIEQFCEFYYKAFDSDRKSLASLYVRSRL